MRLRAYFDQLEKGVHPQLEGVSLYDNVTNRHINIFLGSRRVFSLHFLDLGQTNNFKLLVNLNIKLTTNENNYCNR